MKQTARSAVQWLPADFVESSATGGAFTILAYMIMAAVFICEVTSFLQTSTIAQPFLDEHEDDALQINFDVDMHDIECRNLRVIVFDEVTKEAINALSQDFWLRSVDRKGRTYGMAQKPTGLDPEAEHEREMEKLKKEDGQAELDSDWSNSHDGFNHKSFEHVIQGHDFTMINFFAGWCSHCRNFAPLWQRIADKIHGSGGEPPLTFEDRDKKQRTVRLIKLNCVDFDKECKKQGIDAYPSIRLYKADGSFTVFEGKRNEEELIRWIERTVKLKSYGWATDHEAFERGCNAKGRIQVPRVPGRLELKAGTGDQNLNAKMTNVSHLVRHLSFSDVGDGRYHRKSWTSLPKDMREHVTPLDGQNFITDRFHETWIHDLRVVRVSTTRGETAYQFSEYRRLSNVPVQEIPQAKFHYDIEPFGMKLEKDSKKWYNFITSMMAILGGVFVMMRLSAVAVNGALVKMLRTTRSRRALDFGM